MTTVSPDEIAPGDRVRHQKWGLGTVREIVGEGDRAEAEVMFRHSRKEASAFGMGATGAGVSSFRRA